MKILFEALTDIRMKPEDLVRYEDESRAAVEQFHATLVDARTKLSKSKTPQATWAKGVIAAAIQDCDQRLTLQNTALEALEQKRSALAEALETLAAGESAVDSATEAGDVDGLLRARAQLTVDSRRMVHCKNAFIAAAGAALVSADSIHALRGGMRKSGYEDRTASLAASALKDCHVSGYSDRASKTRDRLGYVSDPDQYVWDVVDEWDRGSASEYVACAFTDRWVAFARRNGLPFEDAA